MAEILNIGIIGTGIHGSRYARHILGDLPGLNLAAISRRDEEGERQAAQWSCRRHADWRELVDDPAVGAVISVVTPDLNPAIAAACAGAGKPLLMEKPLAVDAPTCRSLIAAMGDTPLTVAQTLRYNPVIGRLRELLPKAGRLHSFSASQRLEPSVHPWLADPAVAGGGVVLHTAVHLFDALRFITGREVLRIRATLRRVHNPRLEDLFIAEIEMEGGLFGTADASKVGQARAGRYEFHGDEGQLEGDQIHGDVDFIRGAEREAIERFEPAAVLPPLLRDWAAFVRGEAGNPIPAEEGLAAVRICDAAYRSAETGRWETP